MSKFPDARLHEAVFIDEVGIAMGIYGDLRLRTAYQPVFRHDAGVLGPYGVIAGLEVTRSGKPVPLNTFRRQVPEPDRAFIAALSQVLHLRNYPNLWVEGLRLILDVEAGELDELPKDTAARMRDVIDEIELSPRVVTGRIRQGTEAEQLQPLADALRDVGFSLALEAAGFGEDTAALIPVLKPDLLDFNAADLAAGQRDGGRRLLQASLSVLHDSGCLVMVRGISTAEELQSALDAGAVCLAGDLIGAPALAGTEFDVTPKRAEHFLTKSEGGGAAGVSRLHRLR